MQEDRCEKEFLLLGGIIAVFLAIGTILITTKSLPEQGASNFNALSNMSLQSDIGVIREPTPDDNTYIYAINGAAEQAYIIAQNDIQVKQIIDSIKDRAVTIEAVQPTLLVTPDGQQIHSSGGQLIITANWQIVDGKPYSEPVSFDSLQGKQAESHQRIWSVTVDMDKRKVIDITVEPERILQEILSPEHVYAGMNMFLPDAVKVNFGTTLKWSNESNILHNVVGIYKTASGSVPVDSGFIGHKAWTMSTAR
jgi:hypothetical protein